MAFKALLRVRLRELLYSLTQGSRGKKNRNRASVLLLAALLVYSFGFFGYSFWQMFHAIVPGLRQLNMGWLLFALAGLMSFGLMLVGSVFTAKAQLYEARDNELLLSMPIRPRAILASRLLLLLIINLALGLLPGVPAIAAWTAETGFEARTTAAYVLVFLVLLPTAALTVSALFGWLLHLATRRMRNKSLATVLLSVALLALYFYSMSGLGVWQQRAMMDPAGTLGGLGRFRVLAWIGHAVADADGLLLLGMSFAVAGAASAVCLLLGASFLRLATDQRGAAKRKYVEKREAGHSVSAALLLREFRRLGASPAYLLNGTIGLLMTGILFVMFLVKKGELTELLGPLLAELPVQLNDIGALIGAMVLCMMSSTVILTAPSISLEGKRLWIGQTLPVAPQALLRAKLRLHLLIALPVFELCALALGLLFQPAPLCFALLLLLPAAFTVFMALFGLMENLRHPNFDWINEAQPIKRGLSATVTMFVGFALVIAPCAALGFFWEHLTPKGVALGYLGLLAAADLLLYRWLMTRGARRYRAM